MRWVLSPVLALSLLIGEGAAAQKPNPDSWPEIWFNPMWPQDWLSMWSDTAPWQNAAKRVNVLGVAHWWLLGATDEQILAMFNFATSRHMKVEMETEVITRFADQPCGLTEGYTPPGALAAEMATLKRLNLHIDIMTMDEPVWNGHYNPSPQSCKLPVKDLTDRIASNTSAILAQYPDIQIVEIEPEPGVTNFPDWRETLGAFRAALQLKTGKAIRDIQLDVNWDSPDWIQPMIDMRTFTREQNMGLGVYFDGSDVARSSVAWNAAAVQHFETVEGAMGIIPEQAIFATWGAFPQYNMPETSAAAQTWLIDDYFRQRTVLDVDIRGVGARGRLATIHGKPMANATINAYLPGVDFSQPLPSVTTQGVVPSNAAYGLIGYRLNAECLCQGENDVLVGLLQFQETRNGSLSYSYTLPFFPQNHDGVLVDAETVGGVRVSRVIVHPPQTFYPNSDYFPVTPGAGFNFTVPASTVGGEGWYGHVFLAWFDQKHNGLPGGIKIIPDAGRRLMSTATTAADGSFALPAIPRVGPGSGPVSVQYPGDATHRSVTWSPSR